LLTGFLIPTGDDPEADAATDRVGEAAKRIFGDTEKVAPAPAKKPDLDDLEF